MALCEERGFTASPTAYSSSQTNSKSVNNCWHGLLGLPDHRIGRQQPVRACFLYQHSILCDLIRFRVQQSFDLKLLDPGGMTPLKGGADVRGDLGAQLRRNLGAQVDLHLPFFSCVS